MPSKSYSLPSDTPFLPSKQLRAGMLSCHYEHGNLRCIRYGEKMVLQMIYTAVRNESWTTFPYTIDKEMVMETGEEINISYKALYELGEARYTADVTIVIREHSVSFNMRGTALSSFKKNRVGICILHPIAECAGTIALITQPNGTEYGAGFPMLINPHQPFTEIQGMKITTRDGVTANLAFSGDVFETEDQRNWSDNSYKTYSTRLSEPMPVQLHTGDQIEQQVIIQFSKGKASAPVPEYVESSSRRPFPKIGYSQSEIYKLSKDDINLLKQIPFHHYRVNLHLSDKGWEDRWQLALREAALLEAKIELVIFFSKNIQAEVEMLAEAIGAGEHLIDSLLILEESQKIAGHDLYKTAYNHLRGRFPDLKLGYGTSGYFVEINRNPPEGLQYDFIAFSLTPQAHATDTRTILENLESHQYILSTARSLVGEKQIHISPLMFRPAPEIDERQNSSFGAYWLLRSLYNLSPASVTLIETSGQNGILRDLESPLFKLLSTFGEMKPEWIWLRGSEAGIDSSRI